MRKVLLLEEDATYAAEIRRGLAGLGVDVVLIRDGSVGLARAVSERFDLILVSAELPAVNGFRLCNRVRKDPNAGKVPIFLMGNVEEELKMHSSLATRADDYFKKPIVLAELVARMRLRGVTEGGAAETADLAEGRAGLAAVAELQAKLVEQETAISTLNRELAQARATKTRLEAQGAEVERLRRALDEARATASKAKDSGLHHVALGSLEKRLGEQKASGDAARLKLAAAEGELQTLRARARDQERLLATQKTQLEAAKKQLEQRGAETGKAQNARISELEDELAALRRQNDDLDLKRREVTRALSDLSRRVSAGAEDRARLAKRAADAEAQCARLQAELDSSRERRAAEEEEEEGGGAEVERTVSEEPDERAQSLAEALDRVSQEREEQHARLRALESELERRVTELETLRRESAGLEEKWQGRLTAAVSEAQRAAYAKHDAELDALLNRFVNAEHERSEIQAAFEQTLRDVEVTMERTRADLEEERKAHAATRAAHVKKLDAVNNVLAARYQASITLEREAEQARAEITELEAEIVVLRSELLSTRRELEATLIALRARDGDQSQR